MDRGSVVPLGCDAVMVVEAPLSVPWIKLRACASAGASGGFRR